MNDRVIDAPPARKVSHTDLRPAVIVALLFALIFGGIAWLTEGGVFAPLACAGIAALFVVIDRIKQRRYPPLEIDGDQVTVRLRGRGVVRVDGRSLGALERRSYGIFGRGVAVKPALDAGGRATTETFIGPLRDPAGAWHALDRLRRTGGQ